MSSRNSSQEKRPAQTYESDAEDASSDEQYQPQPQQNRQMQRRRPRQQTQQTQQQQQQSGGGPLDGVGLGGVTDTAGGLVKGATGALGGVAGNQASEGGGKGKSDTLRLRLDLNLDVEITLKAKIHGDLELALLYVYILSHPPPPILPPRTPWPLAPSMSSRICLLPPPSNLVMCVCLE
ncbi:uncharacterized protein E0L32_006815 [Thyridium curvatum]|uniref:Uncharacterized protein n=1 Tax=Thyridium curvatum TaxID=1093900 RepID=A0A507AXN1_9PEZI|nr:uncharacterized protein E0L32_006815 [Thyridium curvatum]TPX12403.1 hypothetical protein E0L32_006815 [Thyridium curvatum]